MMQRRTVLKGAAVAVGAVVLGVNTKSLAKVGPRLELKVTYGPDSRPFQLVQIAIKCDPGDARSRTVELRKNVRGPGSKLIDRFKVAIHHGQEFSKATPVLDNDAKLTFQFYEADGKPWLPLPEAPDEARPFTCEAREIFINQRWAIIDRAAYLCQQAAWHAHFERRLIFGTDSREDIMARGELYKTWSPQQRDRLVEVRVSYKVHTLTTATREILDGAGWL